MSAPPDGPHPSVENARELIARTGILARTRILTDLNLERDREQSSFEKILSDIALDPPLAARVIQLANSAWFGGRVKVDSVAVAFSRLGTKDFYKAAMAAALRFGLGEGAETSPWWKQSDTIAHLCEVVAEHIDPGLIETSFQAGLLRDCAVPLMSRHVTDYSYLADDALGFTPDCLAVEIECNQTDHCTVGSALTAAWKFPETHQGVVQNHHAQTLAGMKSPEAKQVLAVVLFAERVDGWSRTPDAVCFATPEEDALRAEMARAFSLSTRAIDDTMAEMLRLYRLRQSHA